MPRPSVVSRSPRSRNSNRLIRTRQRYQRPSHRCHRLPRQASLSSLRLEGRFSAPLLHWPGATEGPVFRPSMAHHPDAGRRPCRAGQGRGACIDGGVLPARPARWVARPRAAHQPDHDGRSCDVSRDGFRVPTRRAADFWRPVGCLPAGAVRLHGPAREAKALSGPVVSHQLLRLQSWVSQRLLILIAFRGANSSTFREKIFSPRPLLALRAGVLLGLVPAAKEFWCRLLVAPLHSADPGNVLVVLVPAV